MIVPADLLADLQRLLASLEADLRARSEAVAEIDASLRSQHAAAVADKRTASTFPEWREEVITQVGVSWILGCVFVRFLEDNEFLDAPLLSGPGERLRLAQDQQALYVRAHPTDSDRDYLLHVFRTVGRLPALERLFGPHNPVHLFGPSADGAQALLRFWQQVDPASGALRHDFTDPAADTRFVGDLYQDLSEAARKRYALLQTPLFVEEFILDRTLEPAVSTFGLAQVRMIDPTCGSGHFLLGGFHRLLAKWRKAEPLTQPVELVRRALAAVHGVDLNPFAVAIARFRLLIAALRAAEISRVRSAPAWPLNVFTGDSLLFGPEPGQLVSEGLLTEAIEGAYRTEDADEATRLLNQQYHAVVGNPPYITVDDKAVKAEIKRRFKSCHGRWVLVVPFFERFFDLAVSGDGTARRQAGFVGKITGNNFMKREFGKKLIESFLPKWDITHIIDTAGAYLPGHGTPTVVVFGRNQRPVAGTIRAVMGIKGEPSPPEDPAKGHVWTAIQQQVDQPGSESEFVSVVDTPRANFHSHPWSIGGGGASDLKDQLDSLGSVTLETYATDMGVFGMTNADEVMLAPRPSFERASIESETIRALVVGDTVRDWIVRMEDAALFPYVDGSLVELGAYPNLHRWLWPARAALESRATFKGPTYKQEGRRWWCWHQVGMERIRTPLTITFAFVATHNHFVLDRGGRVFIRTAPVIKLPATASEDDHLGLIGLLNSSIACFYLKQVCHNKGSTIDQHGARQRTAAYEDFYEFTSALLAAFPLPASRPVARARELDRLASELQATSPASLAADASNLTHAELTAAAARWADVRARMIALQEDLDWEVYAHYGLLEDAPVPAGLDTVPLALGERAFEIVLARKIAAGEEQSEWFNRHGSTPITELPASWPSAYRRLVERRLELIATDKSIGLIERPEFKRRWNTTPWEEQLSDALRTWLLDRLERLSHPEGVEPALFTVHTLAERTRADADFQRVAELYTGRPEFDLLALVRELVEAESVPALPGQRYKESGLRKRAQWEETWEKQRAEDAIAARLAATGLTGDPLKQAVHTAVAKEVGEIPVPPKYTSADFRSTTHWRLRGKLDVPKERWVHHPGAERASDPTPVLAWAGWNHLQQAQALAAHLETLKAEGAEDAQQARLLAALAELLPWVRQWHNDLDSTYGERMGDFFTTYTETESHRLHLPPAALKQIAHGR